MLNWFRPSISDSRTCEWNPNYAGLLIRVTYVCERSIVRSCCPSYDYRNISSIVYKSMSKRKINEHVVLKHRIREHLLIYWKVQYLLAG